MDTIYDCGIDAVLDILNERSQRDERTRAIHVDRLEKAVRLIQVEARRKRNVREYARKATNAWRKQRELRWQLAMSGRRIAHGEARKIGGTFHG